MPDPREPIDEFQRFREDQRRFQETLKAITDPGIREFLEDQKRIREAIGVTTDPWMKQFLDDQKQIRQSIDAAAGSGMRRFLADQKRIQEAIRIATDPGIKEFVDEQRRFHETLRGAISPGITQLVDYQKRIREAMEAVTGSGIRQLLDEQRLLRPLVALDDLAHRVLTRKALPSVATSHAESIRELVGPEHADLDIDFASDSEPAPQIVEVAEGVEAGLIARLAKAPDEIFSLPPRLFEELVGELLASFGWKIHLTPRSKDGGLDLFAIQKDAHADVDSSWVIECKRYARENKVGVEIVRALYGVKADRGSANAMVVTTSSFTSGAMEYRAGKFDLTLKDHDALVAWMQKYRPSQTGRLWIRTNQLIVPR